MIRKTRQLINGGLVGLAGLATALTGCQTTPAGNAFGEFLVYQTAGSAISGALDPKGTNVEVNVNEVGRENSSSNGQVIQEIKNGVRKIYSIPMGEDVVCSINCLGEKVIAYGKITKQDDPLISMKIGDSDFGYFKKNITSICDN
ncbi:MAG: hypothetical protein WC533_00395 [Candidatus Pacearchaeota archaeon]